MPNPTLRTRKIAGPLFDALAAPAQLGSVDIFWLGQAGFALRSSDCLILIDPYLSNVLAEKYKDALFKHIRMAPPPILPDEFRGVDYLLSTHSHSDHLDPGSLGKIMALNPECVLVCPRSAAATALARGADRDRMLHPAPNEKKSFGAFSLEMIPSAHEELKSDANGDTLFAGYILDIGRIRLYHSGDCVPYPGLAELLADRKVDVALLPVNGRDPLLTSQGVLGNFTVEEAAGLCLSARIPCLIPHHFGMFDFNTVPPEEIERRLAATAGERLNWVVPELGVCIVASENGMNR